MGFNIVLLVNDVVNLSAQFVHHSPKVLGLLAGALFPPLAGLQLFSELEDCLFKVGDITDCLRLFHEWPYRVLQVLSGVPKEASVGTRQVSAFIAQLIELPAQPDRARPEIYGVHPYKRVPGKSFSKTVKTTLAMSSGRTRRGLLKHFLQPIVGSHRGGGCIFLPSIFLAALSYLAGRGREPSVPASESADCSSLGLNPLSEPDSSDTITIRDFLVRVPDLT